MEPLTALIPQGGVAAVLLAVIVYLLRQNHQDRKQYRDDVAAIEARGVIAAAAREEQHSKELGEVRTELAALRHRLEEQMRETEDERRRRWHAEDQAARYRRRLESIGEEVVEP